MFDEFSAPGTVHVRAPGKINVFLAVGEAMPDGYHEVATAYQAVGLWEEVYAQDASDFTVSFTGVRGASRLTTGPDNLALKAARLLARHTGHRGGVRLAIEKNVPIAAGMGGGSADAAGVLVACDALWGTGVQTHELHELAAQLGADVPFALMGGTAIGTGRGEELSPALARGTFHWVLVLPDTTLSTPRVYAELDAHRARHQGELAPRAKPVVDPAVLQALRAGDPQLLAEVLSNDLQAPALHLRPKIATMLEQGELQGALAGIVSGSGPTIAFLTSSQEHAEDLDLRLMAAGYDTAYVVGPVHGARVVP
ncbi:4-(cytidine 5'-diphospho)-2-C-methyl-D-erythritol kinase [Gryllotalpicola ginsengisoli]|uniref:4-(cytidine 5'-diphospho)-2-C-methyl-D-erythritol kinase n=1 Tax=Gryllotalpicola ginsengisoli TaxID=444608 RepID=UPI000481B91C